MTSVPSDPRSATELLRDTLALLLVLLGLGIATASILGPLGTGALAYRTSDTTLNQIIGGDLAGLAVVAPCALVAAVLVRRRHPLGPVVAIAPGLWAVYMYLQLVVGQEYLQLPGNNERFFPLLLALFVLGQGVAVLSWRVASTAPVPTFGARLERTTGVVLLVLATFLVLGLHLPTLLDAMGDAPARLEYVSSPTAFWVVKVMDLGIVVPAALVIGVGLIRHAAWARRPAVALLGTYTLLSTAVTGMAVVMLANGDPDGTVVNVVSFGLFTLLIGGLAARVLGPSQRPTGPVAGLAPDLELASTVGARDTVPR